MTNFSVTIGYKAVASLTVKAYSEESIEKAVQVDTPIERIPFDLEKWKTGKYDVVSRDGRLVEILKTDLKAVETIVIIYNQKDGSQHAFAITGNGRVFFHEDHEDDLFLIPKTRTVWVNLYKGECEYDNEQTANSGALNSNNGLKYHGTISITKSIQ